MDGCDKNGKIVDYFVWKNQISGGKYTRAMFDGEEPEQKNSCMTVYDGALDRWDVQYGTGLTYSDGDVFEASFCLPGSINIYVHQDGALRINQVLATKCKEWTNIPSLRYRNFTKAPVEEYTAEEIRKILDKLPNGKFYTAAKKLIWDIYEDDSSGCDA